MIQNDHKETENHFKEMRNNLRVTKITIKRTKKYHKETQNNFKEMQNDN